MQKLSRSRGAPERPSFAYAKLKEPPNISGDAAPGGAEVVAAPRGRVLPLVRRFGRGARHRTIPLREPPASGALRLPALHRGFVAQAAGPPRLGNRTRSHVAHIRLPGHGRYRARFDLRYVTDMGTNVKGRSLYDRGQREGIVYELGKGANGHRRCGLSGETVGAGSSHEMELGVNPPARRPGLGRVLINRSGSI